MAELVLEMEVSVSLCSSDSEKELKNEVLDAGIKLCTLPSSTNDLLELLAKVEDILSQVGQDPSRSMQDALFPLMKALVSSGLLRHPQVDVKVSVVSCIHEIIRITAPSQPYGDEVMKEIFELTIVTFGMLSHLSGHCYSKALQILETVAKVRSCVMLLDLGCDALIVQIFELFLDTIRSNHPHSVFSNMEEIMTWLLDESDDISLELLKPLLASVKKEHQAVSPISWKLGEEVLKCCSARIQPYFSRAVKLMRVDFDDYSEIISSLCQDEPTGGNLVDEDFKPDVTHLKEISLAATKLDDFNIQKSSENNFILEDLNSLKTFESLSQLGQLNSTEGISGLRPGTLANGVFLEAKTDGGATPGRRGRKPNSLTKAEEGYKQSSSGQGKNSSKTPDEKLNHQDGVNLAKNSSPKESLGTLHIDLVSSANNQDHTSNDTSCRRRGRPKKNSTRKDVVPLGHAKENIEHNPSAAIKMVSGNVEGAEEKPKIRVSRKKKSPRSNRVAIPALSMIVPKKEHDAFSDSEVKPYFLPDCIKGTKATKEKASLRKQNNEKLYEKIMLSPPRRALEQNENLSRSSTKSKRRKKGALLEDEASKRRALVKDYGEELVGSRIKVWWPLDQKFYEGIINSFYPSTKKHEVLYTDGDKEILNLNKERWILIDDDQDADPSTSIVTPAKSERTKAKRITKLKIKQEDNTASSAKRSSKSAPRKSGSKSAEESSAAECNTTRRKELSYNGKANENNNAENDNHEGLKG